MRSALVVALVALSSTASTARAQLVLDRGADYRSPQRFALELKFGNYWPAIDSSPGLGANKPLRDLFPEQDQVPNLVGVEFDWQFLRGFGTLGLAASVGYSWAKAKSFRYASFSDGKAEPCSGAACQRSNDDTQLNVMPFALQLVYRFDVLAERWRVPVVPYLKGGVAYYLWWIQNGSGELARFQIDATKQTGTCGFGGADCGIGGTFGLVAHPGLALQLDILDPGVARTMDAELGINHAYLFAEMHYAWITGFGAMTKMNLSDLSWNVGIAFEF